MKNRDSELRTPIELWKHTKRRSLCIFLSLLWAPTILGVIGQVFAHLPVVSILGDYVKPMVLCIFFILSFTQIKREIAFKYILFYVGMAVIFGLSYMSSIESRPLLDEKAVSFFVMSLPFFYVGLLFKDGECMDWFYYASFITVILSTAYNIFYVTSDNYSGEADIMETNMGLAYNLLPHLLMVLWYMLKKPSIFNIPVVSLGIFLLITYGSRGPIVCLFAFVFLYFFFFKDFKRPLLTRSLLVLAGVCFFFYLPLLLNILFDSITNIGLNTRVVDYLLAGEFISDSSGRDFIISKLENNTSFLPHGMGGAYPIVHTYAHNLLFDLWIDYGYLFGTMIIAYLMFIIIRAYLFLKGSNFRVFLCVLMVCGFVAMFLSKSYLSEPLFYFLIGFSINVGRRGRLQSLVFDKKV